MNKFIIGCTHLLFVLFLSLAFAEEKTGSIEKKYEVANVESFLNIRSGPGTIYSILRAIPSTEKNITVVESKKLAKSTWVKIKHNDEYGWVNQTYLKVSVSPTENKKEQDEDEEHPLWFKMTGVYSLTNIEPVKGESMDTHMLFQLESEQAKVLYDAIKTPTFTDKCTGATAKKIGKMLCLHYPAQIDVSDRSKKKKEIEAVKKDGGNSNKVTDKTKDVADTADSKMTREDIYECHFSINIAQQKIQQGILCHNDE